MGFGMFFLLEKIMRGISKQNLSTKSSIKAAAFLNLAADFSHNFTDGLAISGSFLISSSLGYTTTLAILLHEVYHLHHTRFPMKLGTMLF